MANHVKYQWNKWLNPKGKKSVKLVKGVDYKIMTHSMISYIRANASKRGMRVSLYVDENGNITITPTGPIHVTKQATPAPRKKDGKPKKKAKPAPTKKEVSDAESEQEQDNIQTTQS